MRANDPLVRTRVFAAFPEACHDGIASHDDVAPDYENARLSAPGGKTRERDDYLRALLSIADGVVAVATFEQRDASMLALLEQSIFLVIRPAAPRQQGSARLLSHHAGF